MIAYTRDEIISASDMARGFSAVLNDLINHKKDRFVISKNNKLEAVILSIEKYEYMKLVMIEYDKNITMNKETIKS